MSAALAGIFIGGIWRAVEEINKMSWYIKMYGKKSDVMAALDAWEQDNTVRDFLIVKVNQIPDPTPSGPWDAATHVFVEGSGHGGGIGNLRIDPINPTYAPLPPAAPAPPVSNENVAEGCEKFTGPVDVVTLP